MQSQRLQLAALSKSMGDGPDCTPANKALTIESVSTDSSNTPQSSRISVAPAPLEREPQEREPIVERADDLEHCVGEPDLVVGTPTVIVVSDVRILSPGMVTWQAFQIHFRIQQPGMVTWHAHALVSL